MPCPLNVESELLGSEDCVLLISTMSTTEWVAENTDSEIKGGVGEEKERNGEGREAGREKYAESSPKI